MEKKVIKLLNVQIEALEIREFDLEAWKSGTISLLSRFLGTADPRIGQIEKLKIDYSSWALRDSNAKYNPIETCKKKGRAILQSVVTEVELVGLNEGSGDVLERIRGKISEQEFEDLSTPATVEEALSKMKRGKLQKLLMWILN